MSNRYESLESAAERTGFKVRTIRDYIAKGELTGYRLGRKAIRVIPEEVDALLKPIPTARGN